MRVLKMDSQFLFHHAKDYSAQNRAPDRADAADHRHQQNVDTGLKSEDIAGINECVIARIKSASHTSDACGNRVHPELGVLRIYSEISGGFLVLLDGAQSQPKFAVKHQHGNCQRDRSDNHGGLIMFKLAKRGVLNNAITTGAACNVQVVHDHARSFANTDGSDGEIRSAQSKGRESNHK